MVRKKVPDKTTPTRREGRGKDISAFLACGRAALGGGWLASAVDSPRLASELRAVHQLAKGNTKK